MSAVTISQPPVMFDPYGAVEVGILTIIPEAYEAVREVFSLSQFETRNGYEWALGSMQAKGGRLSIVSGLALDRENIAAASFTDALLDAWRPRHLLLVDIGGAVKGRDDVRVGDVVTHTHLYYYDFNKEVRGEDPSPRNLPHAAPSTRLRELSRRPGMRGDSTWVQKIHVKRPGRGRPKVLPGEMLVGGTLFANSPRLRRLLAKHPKVIAVEMEGVGVARGVLDWSTRGEVPEFLIVRGMSDYCNVPPAENQRARDRWKRYAASAAAAHTYALLGEMAPMPERDNAPFRRLRHRCEPLDNLWEVTLLDLTGRDDEIQKLHVLFSGALPNDGTGLRHAICGEAGMGKSALARQVVENLGQRYQLRWWINAADELKSRSGLRELARQLGVASAYGESEAQGDQEAVAHRYLSDLREYLDSDLLSGRALIVLDNVDDPALKHSLHATVLRYLPARKCDVLITSQSSRWRPLAGVTRLRGLKPAVGTELIAIESRRPELALDPDAQEISTMFGGRPLFLKQVASLLHDGDDPSLFRANLERAPEQALEVLPEIEGFDPLWRTTYAMALERAERSRPGARQMLEVLSCWSAEPIPHRLISILKPQDFNSSSIEALLNTLVDRSLVELQGAASHRSYTVHRVVAALTRTLSKERQAFPHTLGLAATSTLRAIPGRARLRHPEGQRWMTALVPHISEFLDHTRRSKSLDLAEETLKQASKCASMLGLYLWTLSEWSALEEAHDISIELSEHVGDLGGAALGRLRLANVLRQRGEFRRAEDLVHEALPLLERVEDRCDHAWAVTVEARILRNRPDAAPDQALARLEYAFSILESSGRTSEPATVRQLSELHNYISVLHRELSNLSEAEEHSKEGLRLVVGKDLGPEELLHDTEVPDDYLLATHLRTLGGVWRLRGDFRRSMLAHRRALEIFERIYRRDHQDICRALDSLGRAQREWGDLEAALTTFERGGEISERLFGVRHAHTGTAAVNRALVHLEINQPEQAYEEAARGLEIYRVAYSEPQDNSKLQNEATVWALFVQSNTLAALDELEVAVRDHECVLAWRLAHLRPDHAHQASSYFALAEALWLRDRDASRDRVLVLHRQALTIREKVFGSTPNFWLAQSQSRLGQLTSDVLLLQQAHECFSRQLKPGHWRTRAVARALKALGQ